MKKNCTIVDERQRMELLAVEHKGFWMMFYGLVAAILLQVIFFEPDWKRIIGEGIVLLMGSGVLAIGCLRRGLWDYTTTPTQRTYLVFAGVAAGLIMLGLLVIRLVKGNPIHIPSLAILGTIGFAVTYAILALMGHVVLRRRKALEEAVDDQDRAP